MNGPVLQVSDLSIAFGSFDAVKALSFDVHSRETLALVGESGSGKSATALSHPAPDRAGRRPDQERQCALVRRIEDGRPDGAA